MDYVQLDFSAEIAELQVHQARGDAAGALALHRGAHRQVGPRSRPTGDLKVDLTRTDAAEDPSRSTRELAMAARIADMSASHGRDRQRGFARRDLGRFGYLCLRYSWVVDRLGVDGESTRLRGRHVARGLKKRLPDVAAVPGAPVA